MIIPKLYIELYGSEVNGAISSISSIINYIILIEAGLGGAVLFSLYKPISENDEVKISNIIYTSKKIYNKQAFILIPILLVVSVIYSFLIKTSISRDVIFIMFIILSVPVVSDFMFFHTFSNFLNAEKKVYVISIITIVEKLLSLVVILVLISLKTDVRLVLLVPLSFSILRTIAVNIYVNTKYKAILKQKQEYSPELLPSRFDTFFTAFAAKMQYIVPVILASFLVNLSDVSVLSVYNLVLTGVSSFLALFITASQAVLGEVIAKKNRDDLKRVYELFEGAFYIVTTLVFVCTFVLIQNFVNIYTSGVEDANYYRPLFGILLSLSFLIDALRVPQSILISSSGKYRESRTSNIMYISLSLVLSLLFGVFWKLEGIAFGMIIANLFRLISFMFLVNKHLDISIIRKTTTRILLLLSISAFLFFCFKGALVYETNTFFEWVVSGIVVFSITFIALLVYMFFFEKNIMSFLKNKIKSVLKKIK